MKDEGVRRPPPTEEEREFLAHVRSHTSIGYGRMMQIISFEWDRHHPGYCHVATQSLAELSEADRDGFRRLKEQDPLYREGEHSKTGRVVAVDEAEVGDMVTLNALVKAGARFYAPEGAQGASYCDTATMTFKLYNTLDAGYTRIN